MAKVKLPYNAAISTEQVRNVLEQTIGSRYEIRPSPAPTVDWWVVSGPFKAAAVKLKQEPSAETVIRVNGSPPSPGTRLLLTVLLAIPLLYVDLVVCKPVVEDVVQALQNSPELSAGPVQPAAEAPPPASPPPAPPPAPS